MELSTSTNILFERVGMEPVEQKTAIELCARAGYRVLDFCFHDLITYDSPFLGDEWERYTELMIQTAKDCGIVYGQAHANVYDFLNPKADHAFHQKMMERSILASERMGIPWLVIHPSTYFSAAAQFRDSRAGNIAYISRLAEFAGRHHVGIAVENMWDLHIAPRRYYADNAEELTDLVDAIDMDHVGICWDLEHASIMKQNQRTSMELMGKRLKVTHVSDQTGVTNIHVLPFQGVTDWREALEALADIGYEGNLNYEAQWFLNKVPMELALPSLIYSVEVGKYLIGLYENRRKACTSLPSK